MLDGLRILELDFALAVKANCLYLRSDDEKGVNKYVDHLHPIPAIVFANCYGVSIPSIKPSYVEHRINCFHYRKGEFT